MNSLNDTKNNNNLYININKIVDFIYSENFHDILIKEKTRFIKNIENKILEILKCQYKNNESEYKKELLLFEKEKKSIKSRYDKDFLMLNDEYIKFKKFPNKVQYLKRYRRHCINLGQTPLHKCASNKYGKFIEIDYNNNKNKTPRKKGESNQTSYVICSECSFCYNSSFIKMFCSCCRTEYYSSKLEENENENILPATWREYHCKTIIVNEMMKCVKCENILYINIVNKKLVCLNKKCNFSSDSQSIIWKCKICQKDFNSLAKIFNPLENKLLQKAVFKSLLYKEICIPQKIYCCCLINKKVKYFHNKNCKGELYKGVIQNKPIIVCEKCHAVNFYEKFIWICPICGIKFLYQGSKYKKESESNKNLTTTNYLKENLKNHKALYSLEKYYSESKNKYALNYNGNEEENIYSNNNNNYNENNNENNNDNNNNDNNLYNDNNNHQQNFSTNIRLFTNETGDTTNNNFDYKKNTFDSVKRREDILKNTIYTNNIIPKYKYLKKNKKIKYKTLYEILEEREKHKNNESLLDLKNNNLKENRLSDINIKKKEKMDIRTNTSVKKNKNKNKNILIQNYFILSDYRNFNLNNYINKKQTITNKDKNNNIINISGSDELLDKYNENKDNEEKSIKINLKQKLSGDLYGYSNSFLVNSIQNDKNNNMITSNYKDKLALKFNMNYNNLTIEEKTEKNKSHNKNNFVPHRRNIDNELKESNNTLQKVNRYNISLKKQLKDEIVKNTSTEKSNKYINQYYNLSKERIIKSNEKQYSDENKENNSDNELKNNKKYKSSRVKQNQFFKKIYLNRVKNNLNLINNKESNIIKEESNSNIEKEKAEIGICPFGDIEDTFVTKEEFMKITNNCKIPSFSEKNITYLEPIGQGSYGVIYLVEEKSSRKQYALKRVLCNDIEQILKHKKEFELSYSLNHPSLIKIYNILFKYLDMTTYILLVLMEKAETDWNTEITKRNKEKKYYTEEELINIMKQLVSVLLYFQKNNVGHRDVKPQNILICSNNKFKITDLGEAKNTNSNNKLATLKGSHYFMSPNLFLAFKNNGNHQKVKHNIFKSDVFSLGYCFLYAMCLDLKIIKCIREEISMNNIMSIIKKFGLQNKYSDKFMNIVYKMIQIDENKRYDFVELNLELNKNFP